MWIAIAVLVVVALTALFAIGTYNGLVGRRNRYKNAFAQIDVQLKRRYDLIPNLVETAKGYLKHERETLEAVIKARNIALAASQTAAANPADANAHAALAEELLRTGNKADGRAHATEALRIAPNHAKATKLLQSLGAEPN